MLTTTSNSGPLLTFLKEMTVLRKALKKLGAFALIVPMNLQVNLQMLINLKIKFIQQNTAVH